MFFRFSPSMKAWRRGAASVPRASREQNALIVH
jgi:hypothetical protein